MATLRRRIAVMTLAAVLSLAGTVQADPDPAPAQPANYSGAFFVLATLGTLDQEQGIRLIQDQPDGKTQPLTATSGRESVQNEAGADRFFYFDVHDTYVYGGKNVIQVDVHYTDLGFGPIYLEYDAYDPYRPEAKVDEVVYKRVPLAVRTNSETRKTQRIILEDARFANSQGGGADFRIGSSDALILQNVAVRVLDHQTPQPVRISLDGNLIKFDPNDVQPFVETSWTLVPVRAMFNALGIPDDDITWNNELRRVEAKKGQTMIALTIDSEWATVNGTQVKLDQPAVIRAGRTMVPVRFVSEQFGLKVGWDQTTRTVLLTSQPAPVEPAQPALPAEAPANPPSQPMP